MRTLALAGWVAALGAGVVAFEGVAVAAPWAYPLLVTVAGLPVALASGLFVTIRARLGSAAALTSFPLLMTAAEFVPAQWAVLGDFANALTPIATTQFDTPLRLLAAWSGSSAVGLALWAVNMGVYVLVRDRRLRWRSAIAVLPFALAFVPVPGTGGPPPLAPPSGSPWCREPCRASTRSWPASTVRPPRGCSTRTGS